MTVVTRTSDCVRHPCKALVHWVEKIVDADRTLTRFTRGEVRRQVFVPMDSFLEELIDAAHAIREQIIAGEYYGTLEQPDPKVEEKT